MSHLSDVELIDLIDEVLPPERRHHLDECLACRAQAEALRTTMTRATDVDVPEPSPLFWDHFSARVHDAVAESEPAAPGWFSRPTLTGGAAGALATAILVAVVWRSSAPVSHPLVTPPSAPATVASLSSDNDTDTLDPDADQAWALVRAVADESTAADDDDATELGVRPGTAERAIANLTSAERSEFVRLLEAEIRM